ncbi:lysophospholipid acyltransferase family protein [Mesonia ostreae]|uniref:Lysophospholipid acyltransferase family protein n=1 Tax=Mesonia ostreae TaxID=861110 RepID=A0ABU2KK93_9FLAO|nr:lysophospholipid acyltransferase family protein [Mesonia ostreae]MDT0295140.1 lysophospholipid acyltransferase family protein [Mesonia ostreae]
MFVSIQRYVIFVKILFLMQRLAYGMVYPILWLISILPFRLLYAFSDFLTFFIYHIVRYRREAVAQNLSLAFPKKDKMEIKTIEKEFYKHFTDLFLETFKSLSISDTELKKRFVIKNPEELERLESLKKSYVILMAHYASYEWVNALHFYGLTFKAHGVYKPIKNKYFDHLIKSIRSKYDTEMLASKSVPKKMLRQQQEGILASYAMIADQSPKRKGAKHYVKFLNHEVPAFVGAEYIAERLNLSMTYLHVEKVKRGYYEAEFVPLSDEPQKVESYQITDLYFKLLEDQIVKKPAYYLWTHKRWKHRLDK